MKLHYPGEKGRAVCQSDGLSSMTFDYRDVPFSDGSGIVKQILVGVCDICGEVVSIPPQSTPAIKAEREKAVVSIEASLPAVYFDTLDLACYRIDPETTVDFRKRLLLYYIHRAAANKRAARKIARLRADTAFGKAEKLGVKKRLSFKVSHNVSRSIDGLIETTKLSKTDLFKSLVLQIDKDIVEPETPVNLAELRTLAAVASC